MARTLSPRDLAAALGVSESSLKRWIDAGRIRASRTEGGHRRIMLADALAFIRETGAPVLHPELLGIEAAQPIHDQDNVDLQETALYRHLVAGDARGVRRWIAGHQQAGTPIPALCDGPIKHAMHALGELWQHDADGVFVEHRATDLCIQALAQLRTTIETPPHARVALGGAPEDDPYLLPSAMAALVLATEGMHAINLGADTPTGALHRAVAHHRPALVWISASAPLSPPQAHELAGFLRGLPRGTTAVVGGRQARAILDADPSLVHAESMTELAHIARRVGR
ncbi:MAG TPA: helix-turn-helix domain-containing protein [Kofleriaceae bacterium]|nr:helix-turn-helix domain-containing protein [Kofleriaceae bacterium]